MFAMSILLAVVAPTPADPLAPANEGKMQCYRPDRARKTCHSISIIVRSGTASYDVGETVLVSATPLIIFSNHTRVDIKAGAACGQLRSDDIDAGILTMNGMPMDPSRAAILRNKIKSTLTPLFGKTICQTYEPRGDSFVQRSVVDGQARPDLDEPVIWIGPEERYSVAP